jgi:hypothetical protein
MPFENDQSDIPAGRAAGAAEELFDAHAENIVRQLIDLALRGDPTALRLCLDRISPPLRDRPPEFALPPIETPADAVAGIAAVVAGIADGSLTAAEGLQLARMLRNMVETLILAGSAERASGREERDAEGRSGPLEPPRMISSTQLHEPRGGEAELRAAA